MKRIIICSRNQQCSGHREQRRRQYPGFERFAIKAPQCLPQEDCDHDANRGNYTASYRHFALCRKVNNIGAQRDDQNIQQPEAENRKQRNLPVEMAVSEIVRLSIHSTGLVPLRKFAPSHIASDRSESALYRSLRAKQWG